MVTQAFLEVPKAPFAMVAYTWTGFRPETAMMTKPQTTRLSRKAIRRMPQDFQAGSASARLDIKIKGS